MVNSILSESSIIPNSTQTSTTSFEVVNAFFQIPVYLSIPTRVNTASQHVVHYISSMSLHLDVMLLTVVVPAAVTDIFYKSIHDSLNTSVPVNVSLQWIVSREAISLHTCVSAFDIICFLATGANSSQSPQLHCIAQYHS